jgi:hypothetical protein
MLLEAGVIVLFLPVTRPLPDLRAVAQPLPMVAFLFHWLIVRVMWGFAKFKFVKTRHGDDMYLRGFLAWMPIPNAIGWYIQHAPRWFLRVSYAFMWFAEVLCPALVFFPGWPRLIGAAGLTGLQLGIHGTGNWAFFNIGYIWLCVSLLDTRTSLADISWSAVTATPSSIVLHAVLFGIALVTLGLFALNTWVSNTWVHWSLDEWTWKRPWLKAVVEFYRWITSFRMFAAYGVFPPHPRPPVRTVVVMEGSHDGVNFEGYEFKYMPTTPKSRPPFVAPHDPRLDWGTIYAAAGISHCDYLSGIVGTGKVFGHTAFSHYSWLHRLGQRLIEGEPSVLALMGHNPFPGLPPRFIRVSIRALTPTSIETKRATGEYWEVRHVGVVFPPMSADPLTWTHWLPPPELFHPEFMQRRRRCAALRAMRAAFDRGVPHEEAVRVDSDIRADEVKMFWRDLVPAIAATRGDWQRIHESAAEIRRRFDRGSLLRLERIAERYAFILRVRMEPHLYGDRLPKMPKRSGLRLHFLAHEIILDGREFFETVMRDAGQAVARAERQTEATSLHLVSIFRHEIINYHALTLRISQSLTPLDDVDKNMLIGILELRDFICTLKPEGESWIPVCKVDARGEWELDGFETAKQWKTAR